MCHPRYNCGWLCTMGGVTRWFSPHTARHTNTDHTNTDSAWYSWKQPLLLRTHTMLTVPDISGHHSQLTTQSTCSVYIHTRCTTQCYSPNRGAWSCRVVGFRCSYAVKLNPWRVVVEWGTSHTPFNVVAYISVIEPVSWDTGSMLLWVPNIFRTRFGYGY